MSDLIQRLRDLDDDLADEAADEIERLNEAVANREALIKALT